MKVPYDVIGWRAFNLEEMTLWVQQFNPAQIEMSDRQYAWYANLVRTNKRDFNGIPIVFLPAV